MTTTMTEGALARVTVEHVDASSGTTLRVGDEFEVEDYVSAAEAEDGIAFYWGSRSGGVNNVCANAEHVTQVMSADQMQSRAAPTAAWLAHGLSMLHEHKQWTADESEPDGDDLLVYGRTHDGLRIAVRLRVTGVELVDE